MLGYDSSLGFVSLANKPHTTESEVVSMLRRLGAVLYCKTNVPTGMMMPETVNNLLGRTVSSDFAPSDSRQTPTIDCVPQVAPLEGRLRFSPFEDPLLALEQILADRFEFLVYSRISTPFVLRSEDFPHMVHVVPSLDKRL